MSGSVVADAVTAANIVAKLPFWAELDTEAVLATFREKHLPQSSDLTIESLQALFYGSFRSARVIVIRVFFRVA